ncbi:zinc ribbon domain-containing protein [Planococcus sp. 1R117A]|uniref:zinc ribbon domain-containing protein n=1 Tax=Planococcus sp. 1R117A TaxID=3447020 RepID=UPI003EDCA475
MSEFQNKVGGGLNMIQGSLQQGKQKLQTAQEISQIEQTLSSLRQKRHELIVSLGNKVHKKVRLYELKDIDFSGISADIEALDKKIYHQAKVAADLKATNENMYICTSCNSEVMPSDRFCGSCGTPVIIPETIEEILKTCKQCEEDIPNSASFCPCCGHATASEKMTSDVL